MEAWELVLDARARLGEAPLWDHARKWLLWVDIDGQCVHGFDPADARQESHAMGQRVGTVVVRRRGGWIVALQRGLAAYDPSTARLEQLADPEGDNPDVRFNDGKCDPAGRFWAGTMTFSRTPGGARLWCLDAELTCRQMLDGVTTSNGIAWSADARTMYYIDSNAWRVDAFDYELASGAIANRRPAFAVPEAMGKPDGMAIDAEGMLWVAHYRGGRVCRWDPATGRLLQTVQLPVTLTTACALGGEGLDELYVTSARGGLNAEELAAQPLAGGLFRIRVDTPGVPSAEFAG